MPTDFNAFAQGRNEGSRAYTDELTNRVTRENARQQYLDALNQAQDKAIARQAASFLSGLDSARLRARDAGMTNMQFLADYATQMRRSQQFLALSPEAQSKVMQLLVNSVTAGAPLAQAAHDEVHLRNAINAVGMDAPQTLSDPMLLLQQNNLSAASRAAGLGEPDDQGNVLFMGVKMPAVRALAIKYSAGGVAGGVDTIEQSGLTQEARRQIEADRTAASAQNKVLLDLNGSTNALQTINLLLTAVQGSNPELASQLEQLLSEEARNLIRQRTGATLPAPALPAAPTAPALPAAPTAPALPAAPTAPALPAAPTAPVTQDPQTRQIDSAASALEALRRAQQAARAIPSTSDGAELTRRTLDALVQKKADELKRFQQRYANQFLVR